jgi:hypothetical protein
MEFRSITPDKRLARSLVRNAEERERALAQLNPEEFSTTLAEGRYELLKELVTALMALEGYKPETHESLALYLLSRGDFSPKETEFLDELRKVRNNISYRGYRVTPDYLRRREALIRQLTEKLRALITQYQ